MFKKIAHLKFNTKLMISILLSISISILLISYIATTIAITKITDLGRADLKDIHTNIYTLLDNRYTEICEKLTKHMSLIESILASYGKIYLDKNNKYIQTIKDQTTLNEMTVKMNKLYIGDRVLNQDVEIVDYIKNNIQCDVTIFQLTPHGLVRISTSILDNNHNRALNTYLVEIRIKEMHL